MYILVFDYGTTAVKAALMDKQGRIVSRSLKKTQSIYPQPGWVEQLPLEIWEHTLTLAEEVLAHQKASWKEIAAIGIANQRETTIVWDPETGTPLYNAIVWQCRRTAKYCQQLKEQGLSPLIREKTGLMLDPYFSATKIRWILDYAQADPSKLQAGTVDSWIIWNLSKRKTHATDPTNASRTLLYNIHTKTWDPALLELFNIENTLLPKVKTGQFAQTNPSLTGGVAIPITGVAGDQQAALFGQKCWGRGEAKSTYGTGAFIIMNQGDRLEETPHGLLATLAYDKNRKLCYAVEGSIFMAGAVLEWLQKSLGIIDSPQEADQLAASLTQNEGVYLIPAMAGLGAPQWDPDARGVICGLTQSSGRAHIARAAFEAMAYQTRDVVEVMAGPLTQMKVDGGVSKSPFLMQFLADQLAMPIIRSLETDVTSKGAGYLAGLNVGFWTHPNEILALEEKSEKYMPVSSRHERDLAYQGWKKSFSMYAAHIC